MLTTTVPSECYETDVPVVGTPGARVVFGHVEFTAASVRFSPRRGVVTLDGRGRGAITLVATVPGTAGVVAIGTAFAATEIPSGVTSFAVTTAASRIAADVHHFLRELVDAHGPALQATDGSLVAQDLWSQAIALADAHATITRVLDEAFPQTATEMLDEWERHLGTPVDPSADPETRRAVMLAKKRANGGATMARILAAAQAIDPTTTLYGNLATAVDRYRDLPTPSFPVPSGARQVFLTAAKVLAATYDDAAKRAALVRQFAQQAPAHALVVPAESIGFLTDDPNSLTDRTLLNG